MVKHWHLLSHLGLVGQVDLSYAHIYAFMAASHYTAPRVNNLKKKQVQKKVCYKFSNGKNSQYAAACVCNISFPWHSVVQSNVCMIFKVCLTRAQVSPAYQDIVLVRN